MKMMACASAMAQSCTVPFATNNGTSSSFTSRNSYLLKTTSTSFFPRLRASSSAQEEADCNTEECAPDKEVGKVSMEWLAGEKTKVVGTFPPRSSPRAFTGYVEKDTAGQTNIYSVEPIVYVAESAISSGTAGSSSSGAENTAGLVGFIGLISVAAASSIILQLGKAPSTQIQTVEYSGQSLNYYINKFKSAEIIAPVSSAPPPAEEEASTTMQSETAPPAEESPPVTAFTTMTSETAPPAEETSPVTIESPVTLEAETTPPSE